MRRLLALLLGSAALLAACGDDGTDSASGSAQLVDYSRTGGFAYTEERLVVERDGSAVLFYNEGPETLETEFDIEADELAGLEERIEAAQGIDAPEPSPACADCFVYSVEAEGVAFELDDVAFTTDLPPEVLALILELGEIVRLARERA